VNRRRSYAVTLTLLLILLLAGALRVYDLDGESLWYDEAASIADSHRSLSDILTVVPRLNPDHPILYFLILHSWMRIAGDSPAAVRAPSAAFGLAAVAVLFLVGLELRDAALGLVVAFLSAVSYFLIQYAQEARMYSLLVLLSSVSYYFFIRMVRRGETGGAAVGYVASTTLLLYTHYHAGFIVLAQLCTVLCLWRRMVKVRLMALAAMAVAALALSVWLLTHWVDLPDVSINLWIPVPTIYSLAEVNRLWAAYLYNYSIGPFVVPNYSLPALFWVLTLVGCFLWPEAQAPTSRTRWFRPIGLGPAEETVTLALWLLVPVLAPYTLSKIGSFSIFWPRFLIGAVPAFYLLVARGVVALNRRWLTGGLCLVILALSMPGLLQYYHYPQKRQWDHVARLVEREGRPGDLVVLSQPWLVLPFTYYYRGSLDWVAVSEQGLSKVSRQLKRAMVGHRRIWQVSTQRPRRNPVRALRILVPKGPVARHQFIGVKVGVKVYLYEIPPHLREGR